MRWVLMDCITGAKLELGLTAANCPKVLKTCPDTADNAFVEHHGWSTRSAIKERTAESHAAMEVKLRVLLDDQISLIQYLAIQKKFYGFYLPAEERLSSISGWDDPELQLPKRLKLPFLAADLAALQVTSQELTALPLCNCLPPLRTIPQALGCLYVLEGSTLGGQIITRHVTKWLPVDEASGCSFFNSYGRNLGSMWKTFLEVMESHCEANGNGDEVAESACLTFHSLERWFTSAD